MEIVPASLRDLGSLRRVEQACFPLDAWPLLDLIAVLSWPDVVRLKAVENGQMIGFIAGDPRSTGDMAWIATVGVLPQYRRQGIGRALLRECESRLKQPRIRLCVRVSNEGAINMYKQEGYVTADIWREYYNDKENALVMEKVREQSH
jgi:ribosomal protein S18 acetylase RimI-like enzyme